MGKNVLSLDTMEPDRDFIAVNGKAYFLRSDDELSIRTTARMRRITKNVADKIGRLDDLTDEEIEEVEGSVDEMLDLVLVDFPTEIREKLTVSQKYQVVGAFTTAASRKRAGATAGDNGSQPTTDASSPAFAGITEGTSTTG